MAEQIDPVTNPLGALQSMALGRAQQGDTYRQQQQQAYAEQMARLEETARNPEDGAQMWGALAEGALAVPPVAGNFGSMLASMGAKYGQYQQKAQAQRLAAEQAITNMRGQELRALESKDQTMAYLKAITPRGGAAAGKFVPVPGIPGMMVNNIDPTQTVDLRDAATQKQILDIASKNRDLYDSDEAAMEAAMAMVSKAKPAATSTAPYAPRPTTDASTAPQGEVSFDFDFSQLTPAQKASLQGIIAAYQANPSPQTQARVEEVIRRFGVPPEAAPAPGFPARKDKAAEAAKMESGKEAEKMYATQFEENVLKPAEAFTNTGKIMQDFNYLGQMQSALKNGRLKEFMAGDTGRWAMDFLPENSDLRKGIANAQEAEKLTAGMINQILLAAKGVQTEGDAQRARSQVTSIGTDPDANKYLEAYINETAQRLQLRRKMGEQYRKENRSFEGYDDMWQSSPYMRANATVKKLGATWVGSTQYISKYMAKNPGATEADAIESWNRVK